MPRLHAYALWLKSQESDPLPPAPAAALVPLAVKFTNAYPKIGQRIGKPVTKIVMLEKEPLIA